jgi:chemotaxis protein MotB
MGYLGSTVIAGSLLVAGCVSQGKYDAALADARSARELAAQQAREAEARDRNAQARAQALKGEIARLKQEIEQASGQLEQLRKGQRAAEEKARLLRELALKFKRMIDAGQLSIQLRDGRMVLALPNDVLFDSGKTKLKPAGKSALEQVAAVLATIEGRHFQVAGHTDNEPIKASPFKSNWELSTARGVVVVQFLIDKGVSPEAVSAAGYGEFDPVASNDTREGMARNRRIEIVLQPDIDELITLPPEGEQAATR